MNTISFYKSQNSLCLHNHFIVEEAIGGYTFCKSFMSPFDSKSVIECYKLLYTAVVS